MNPNLDDTIPPPIHRRQCCQPWHSLEELPLPPHTKPEGPCCWWLRDEQGNYMSGAADNPCANAVAYQIKGSKGKGALYCAEHAWFPGFGNVELWDGLSPDVECSIVRKHLERLIHDLEKSSFKSRERALVLTQLETALFWNGRTMTKLTIGHLTADAEKCKVEPQSVR